MKYNETSIVISFLPLETHESEGVLAERTLASSSEPLVVSLRKGFDMREFYELRNLLQVPEEELGRYLGISPATLHRRKKAGKLDTPESERIVRIARLFGLAMETLEKKDAAREWLKAPNPGTDGEAPLSYADTEFGAREVENLLGRLDHGVFC